jgi:hypothetical protein
VAKEHDIKKVFVIVPFEQALSRNKADLDEYFSINLKGVASI